MDCPNKCSGHGQCYTMSTLQNLYNYSHTDTDVYNVWDAHKSMGCACDYGYTGGACEMKMCPKGHDPLVEANATHRIVIRTWAESGALTGAFKLYFMGHSIEFNSVVASFSGDRCAERFAKLPGVKSVTCSHNATDYAHGGAGYFVDFTGWPTNPKENNIFTHNGKPSADQFHCDTTNVTSADGEEVYCNVFEGAHNANNDYVAKYDYCSNRGICDLGSGECACYQNFYGAACEVYVPQEIYADYVDVMTISANDTDFTDTVLRIQDTIRGDAGDWSSFYVETNEETYNSERTAAFNITNDGDVIQTRGGWSLQGKRDGLTGVTIHAGGLRVHDGITIESEGLEVVNKGVAGDLRFSGQGKVSGGMTFEDTLLINSPGLTITGGLTVNDGGMVVPDCLTPVPGRESVFGVGCLTPKGFYVAAGGADFHHGLWLRSGMNVSGGLRMDDWRTDGVTIETGGLEVYEGGMTVWYKGMVIDRDSRAEGGLAVTGGVTVSGYEGVTVAGSVDASGGVSVGNKAYVQSGGVSVTGSGTIYDGGLVNYADMFDIHSGGLHVDVSGGGMTVKEGIDISQDPVNPGDGLSVTLGGLTVAQGAMTITGGVTVGSGGLTSSTDGAVSLSGGLGVTGGLSQSDHSQLMESSRVSVTGGLTVMDVGLNIAEGGLSVSGGGLLVGDTGVDLTITEGLRVKAGGLTVASSGGLEVSVGTVTNYGPEPLTAAGGATVTGGAVFRDQGMDHYFTVHGALSVEAGGMRAAQKGMNVSAGTAIVNLNGLSVNLARATLHPTAAYDPKTSTINTLESATTVNVGGGVTVGGGISIGTVGLGIDSVMGNWGRWHHIHDGMTAAGGVAVSGGGVEVGGTGSSVFTDSAVEGGVNLISGDVRVTGSRGAKVASGGVAVNADGLYLLGNNQDQATTHQNTGTYWRGGLNAGGKVTVSDGLFFRGGGTRSDVTNDGVQVTAGGMFIRGGGMVVTGGTEITTLPWSEVHSGQEHEKRDPYAVSVTGGLTVLQGGLSIDHPKGPEAYGADSTPTHKEGIKYGLTLRDTTVTDHTGLRVAGGLSVDAHGITVASGGVSVGSGGLGVSSPVAVTVQTGGMLIASGGFQATGTTVNIWGGLNIASDGMELHAGLQVQQGGLVLEGSGDLVNADEVGGLGAGTAIAITGAVHSKGAIVVSADGVEVTGGGMFVKDGVVTIQDTGIASLKGGLTVTNTGLSVSTGGVTVLSGGLNIAGVDGGGQSSGYGLDIDDTTGGLDIQGDLTIHQNTYTVASEVVSSDRRLKTALEPLRPQESLGKVRQLRGVYYYWNDKYNSSAEAGDEAQKGQKGAGARRVGLLAQDVQGVLPEAVRQLDPSVPSSTGYLGVKYLSVLPLLVEALRALSDNISTLWDAIALATPAPSTTTTANTEGMSSRERLQASISELDILLTSQEKEMQSLEGVSRARL